MRKLICILASLTYLLCAGDSYLGQRSGDFSVILNGQGEAYAWGYNNKGQLGDNSVTNKHAPIAVYTGGVLSGKVLTEIVAGKYHTVAFDSDGKVYSWGWNLYGQLGDNSTSDSHIPVAEYSTVAWGKTYSAVAVGESHSVALDSDGKVIAWGSNFYGQLGDNTSATRHVATDVFTSGVLSGKTITAIAAGDYHTVALDSDGKIYAWGYNNVGQLGNNSTTESPVPVEVNTSGVLSGKTITAIAAGYTHTVALDSDGKVYSWGQNTNGQLGNNSTSHSSVPVAVYTSGVLSGKTITAISAGGYTTIALDSDGKVYAWGYNNVGQLGDNSTTQRIIPVAVYTSGVLSDKTITAVAAGSRSTVVLGSEGKVYSWGENENGQLGNNSTTDSHVPVQVLNSDYSEFVCSINLTSFTANNQNGNVALTWHTGSETENLGYLLERSESNEDAWTVIVSYLNDDALIGHGTTTGSNTYQYTDDTVQPGVSYVYRLGDIDYNNCITWHDEIEITIEAEDLEVPSTFGLENIYPNPFNPSVNISYSLENEAQTELSVYDINGKKVTTLINDMISAGTHNLLWQPMNISTGIYIVRLNADNINSMQKIIYVK